MLGIKTQLVGDLKLLCEICKDIGVQFMVFGDIIQIYICDSEIELNFNINDEQAVQDMFTTLDTLYTLKTMKGKY